MKSEFMMKASRLINNAGLQIKKHSPEILMVVGIAGTVASTVLACKATTKINQILDETKQATDIIHAGMESGKVNNVEYTVEDGKKDLTIVYAQTGVKLVKLYAPAIALGALSIASIVSGHKILKGRNLALAAAYTVVDKGFKNYRKNVVDRFGKDLDRELRYNIKAKEIEVESTDEKGKKKSKKEIINTIDKNPLNDISEFARFFDETCDDWQKDPEYNLMFLRRQQDYANEILRTRGHLFLNEVYDMLGMQRIQAGQVVGWIYDEKNPIGDNYVDFNIYSGTERSRMFVNGYERSILLDFNVDGVIYNLI
jgi:hypothetical protein